MPELPEVQTVVSELRKKIIDKEIISVRVNLPKLIKNVSVSKFVDAICGTKIIKINRIGKNIIFDFNNGYSLISHLRMEGKYFFNFHHEDSVQKAHVIFNFVDAQLFYYDSRQFGTFYLYRSSDVASCKEIKKIGMDPLDKRFSWLVCKELFSRVNRNVKVVLMDQTFISGIGNIYANEILFACCISPFKRTSELTDDDFKNISFHSQRILRQAIEYKGTTIFSFQFAQGQTGSFQKMLQVHSRNGKSCYRCTTLIKKVKINGRGTFYCPHCQQ